MCVCWQLLSSNMWYSTEHSVMHSNDDDEDFQDFHTGSEVRCEEFDFELIFSAAFERVRFRPKLACPTSDGQYASSSCNAACCYIGYVRHGDSSLSLMSCQLVSCMLLLCTLCTIFNNTLNTTYCLFPNSGRVYCRYSLYLPRRDNHAEITWLVDYIPWFKPIKSPIPVLARPWCKLTTQVQTNALPLCQTTTAMTIISFT